MASSDCNLTIEKKFGADTDRGMEARAYKCKDGEDRITVEFGLSRKDVIFQYSIKRGTVDLQLLERKYETSADGTPDFNRAFGARHLDSIKIARGRIVSLKKNERLRVTKTNVSSKVAAILGLLNNVRSALESKDANPEFDAVVALTAIFDDE